MPPKRKTSSIDPSPAKKIRVTAKREVKRESDEENEPAKPVTVKIKKECKSNFQENDQAWQPFWADYELVAEQKCMHQNIARNVIKLLEEGNTIPFIARYRRDATNNMSPEMLLEVKSCFEETCELKQKIRSALKEIKKTGNCDEKVEKAIRSARTFEELEITYAPYKPDRKGTLAERAKELGLEEPSLVILNNSGNVNLDRYVTDQHSRKDIETGIIHLLAYNIAVDSEVLTFIRELRNKEYITLESKKSKTKSTEKSTSKKKVLTKNVDENKFENYFDYKIAVKYIKPHQVLAINRGEKLKFLSVKVTIPDSLYDKFYQFCFKKWIKRGPINHFRKNLLDEGVKDSYSRLVKPLITREIRAELKKKADKASYEVFSQNLKHLLMEPPLKGQIILGVDPGFTAGCKLGLISQTGSVLDFNVIYPHGPKADTEAAASVLEDMVKQHKCSVIAIGNGTACRETEMFISNLIQDGLFQPLDVKYVIVSEDGASIYSCSAEAKKEFPKLDTNIISAISLARRLQDPLAELVKIEPHHLGIGMYQHDLKKKSIEEALEEVVSECVSFIGVDLNTASQSLLRRVAGLTDKRAANILKYREEKGPFLSRDQLNKVTGIGPKVFKQCAGFLRVGPTDAKSAEDFYGKSNTTKLDCTYVHPESYDVALKLIKKLKLHPLNIGQEKFIQVVKSCENNAEALSKEFGSPVETVKLIIEALRKPLNYDLRSEIPERQIFRREIANINDLKQGTLTTGRVSNVTHFGCFVDIGVGSNGLIHVSKMNKLQLQVGDKVEVKVLDIDVVRKRIGLQAVKLIMDIE